MSAEHECPVCGQPVEGSCRRCLVDGLFLEETEHFDLPEELGGFRLMERIGRGASGEVWKAFQPGPDREVAVKVFLDPLLGGSADRSRFHAEAQALGKLDDPGIVPVYATGEDEGFLFIASRWMSGGTLAERKFPGPGRSNWREVARLMAIIARAVAHAHGLGLVHRDIKPANVLLDDAGNPYLADFGIAEPVGLEVGRSTSGTPAYMAPEQARGEVVTTAADIFSLGAMMHELLTGAPPVRTEDSVELALDGVDRDLAAICRRCLSVALEQRYASAMALADDLECWLRGEPVAAREISTGERLWKWSRRRPALAGLSLLVALSALGLAGTFVVGSEALRRERNEAVKQSDLAREQERLAQETAAAAREQAYAADIYLASRALEDGQLGVARQMLERHAVSTEAPDLRSFEWHAYRSLCEGEEVDRFSGHDSVVSAVAFSPCGKWLASTGWNGSLFVRDVLSREIILQLPNDRTPPKGAAEIPLMTKVLTRSPELRSMVLSAQLNVDEYRMRGRPSRLGELTAVAWSPDGKLLVTAGAGSYVRLWSFPEAQLVGALPLQHGLRIGFSDDGRDLVTLNGPNGRLQLVVHEVDGLEPKHRIDGVGPTFCLHGEELVYQDAEDKRIHSIKMGTFEPVASWTASELMKDLVFSSDGSRIHGVGVDSGVEWQWTSDGESLPGPDEPMRGVSKVMAVVGDELALAGTGQMIGIRPSASSSSFRSLRGHEDEIMDLVASPDRRWLASGSKDRTVRLWRVDSSPDEQGVWKAGLPPLKAHSPDRTAWLSETEDGRVFLGKTSDFQVQLGAEEKCRALCFGGQGSWAVTWRDKSEGIWLDRWSVADGRRLVSILLEPEAAPPRVVAAGGDCVWVTGKDSKVEVFDLREGALVGELPETGGGILRLVVAPSGRRVAAVYWPRMVQVGTLGEAWSERMELTAGILGPLAFSPDGELLASGNNENRVAVHDVRSGEALRVLQGHREALVALAFSPDGRSLVSSSLDRTVRLWHVPTWRDLGVFDRGSIVNYLGFAPDSKGLLMGATERRPRRVPAD